MGLLKSDENLVELWGVVTYGEGMETSSISAEAGAATNAASATARLCEIAAAAIAARPAAHHINVRTNYGAYSAALFAFGERVAPSELAWENDLQLGGRLAVYHDEDVSRLLALASERLNAVLYREILTKPVEVTVKVGDNWEILSL
jgi:hypothetical protein